MEDNKNIEMEKTAEVLRDMVRDGKVRTEELKKKLTEDNNDLLENHNENVLKNIKRDTTCSYNPTAMTETFLSGFCLGAFVTVCVAFATRAINRH